MSGRNVLLETNARIVVAHRGASSEAPENTLPAFERAVACGDDALEMDVHVTADGVPVVIHDATLDRTTSGSGSVAALTLAQVREADAGARFTPDGSSWPFRGRGVQVPTLVEVLRAVPYLPFVIEIKSRAAQHAVRRVLLEQDAAARCLVASFDAAALAALREPPFMIGATRTDVARLCVGAPFGFAPAHPAYEAIFTPLYYGALRVVTKAFLALANRIARPVHVWTVDDVAVAAQLWREGATGIVTNTPARMVAQREEMGPG